MNNTQNFLTDNIEDTTGAADNASSVTPRSSTSILNEIDIITNYESSNLGNDINNRFSAIDSNFKRIVQSDYLRGAPGANYGSKHIYFAKLDPNRSGANSDYNNNSILYNPMIETGGSNPVIMDNAYIIRSLRDAILSKCLGNVNNLNLPSEPYINNGQEVNGDFWNIKNDALKSIQTSNGTINWHDNIATGKDNDYNVFTFIVEDQNGALNAYSSLVYIFIDKRFEYITDANKKQYEGLVDLSCAIYFSYKLIDSTDVAEEDKSYGGVFESVQTFPTIEYNTDGNFYWKIYGSNSGLLAQGPKGDAASSAMIYCTYETIDGADDYVKLKEVLVTYIEDGEQVTKFMDVKAAVDKNYINLEAAKNSSNHTKICAFCVPYKAPAATNVDDNSENEDGIIMGTVCYTEDQNITKDNNSNYIVRFNRQLSFNHLFNQHNFFNIMLENYNDGSTTSTENKFGALFIPMSENSETAEVAAHTIYSTGTGENQNTLNILPVQNIKNGIDKNITNIDSVILADCPMNVYYDVNLINNPLHFKTSSLIIKKTDNEEDDIKISHNYLTEESGQYRAKFDINYLPYIKEKNNNYIATPSLNINCDWTYTEINKIPVTPKPTITLNDLAVLLKFDPNSKIKHSVLDFITDLTNDKYIDNWIGASATRTYELLYVYTNNVNANDFYLEREAGSAGSTNNKDDISKWNLNTAYCNYNPMILYSTDGTLANMSIYKTSKIAKDESAYGVLYNNIYFYGNVYPYKRRIASKTPATYTDANGTSYRNYIDMYTYTFKKDDASGSTDFAQLNFKEDSNNIIKCPSYSLYRDYRSGNTLTIQDTNANTYLYTKTQTKANESHPLDYSDNSNIASHEGGVVYPHKIILTNDANSADGITNESDLRNNVHQLNKTSRLERSGEIDETEKYENYGTCIAYIKAPTGTQTNSAQIKDTQTETQTETQTNNLLLNNAFFSNNSAVNFDLKFDKLLAPIINIRSNAYTSPGTEFMRGVGWNNNGLYLASFNTLNTGLAINKAIHSLSYRLVYEVDVYDDNGDITGTPTIKRTSNIPIRNTKSTQNISTGICGNMRRVFFKGANDENWDGKTEKTIRDNAPMMGQLCDPTLMTRAAFPIALEDYPAQKSLFKRNESSDKFDGSVQQIVKRFGLNIHKNNWMYGASWLYNGGNISTDNTQLPFGDSYMTTLAKYENGKSRSNSNGIMENKCTFKLYSDSNHCTPNDTLYNIGMYRMTYKDAENKNQVYVGNDGYRTVTLPYYPGDISVTVNSSAFNKIPIDERANARVTGIEIIYNCEVVFDTLLDVISGNVYSKYFHWGSAVDIYGDQFTSGLNIFITDAVSHSKFLKHDLKSQINRLYAPSRYDTSGMAAIDNHIWDFRPTKTVQIDASGTNATLKNEECYSGYRGITYRMPGDYTVDHTGAGYLYASRYDLDSYYNRAFINPYYYTVNGDKNGTQKEDLSDLSFNFRIDNEINTYQDPNNLDPLDPRLMTLRYAHTGLSLKPIDGSRNKIQRLNKLFNHPPYFMGVGVITVKNEDVLYEFKNGNNKGIIYLCHQDDEAYATSNIKEDQLAINSQLIGRDKAIILDDLIGRDKAIILDDLISNPDTRNPYRGFSSLLMRNNIDFDNNTRDYMSPFFKTFGPNTWNENGDCGTLISDENTNKPYIASNNTGRGKKMDALNIIDYWYPKSTDIFNNPFMFNNPQEINTNYQTTKDITLPNYSISKSGVTEQSNLSENFNLSNKLDNNLAHLKLAWRKFNIKNTSKGFYNGHTITYGELQDCTLSMLNIEDNGSVNDPNNLKFITNIEHTNFIVDIAKNANADSNIVDIYDASNVNTEEGNTGENIDTELKTSNEINAHICNDGIIWSDNNKNYMAIRMTGDEQKYDGIYIDGKHGEGNSQGELVSLAGANVLPETQLYISKNGSKAAYQIDFITLLLAAGKYLEASGKITDSAGETKGFKFINEITLDELINPDNENGDNAS